MQNSSFKCKTHHFKYNAGRCSFVCTNDDRQWWSKIMILPLKIMLDSSLEKRWFIHRTVLIFDWKFWILNINCALSGRSNAGYLNTSRPKVRFSTNFLPFSVHFLPIFYRFCTIFCPFSTDFLPIFVDLACFGLILGYYGLVWPARRWSLGQAV